jgi:hypothetical protein
MKNNVLLMSLICFIITLSPTTQAASANELAKMADMLDQADQQDFQDAIDQARDCISAHNFSCAENKLSRASKLITNSRDKNRLALTRQALSTEKQNVRDAERAEQERERQREYAEQRQRAQEEADEAYNNRMANMAALTSGLQQINTNYANILAQKQSDNAENARRFNKMREDSQRAADAQRADIEQRRRASQQEQANQQARTQLATQSVQQQQQRQQSAERDQARAQELNRQKLAQEASDRLATQQAAQAQAREETLRRQKQAQAAAEKLAAQQAEKAAAEKAERAYLAAMVQGVRLVATKCPDGEGHYYATGTRPSIKPEVVSCVDVYYQASCPDGRVQIRGVAKNFIGMSGCFGDTYQIDPKPACAVKDVRIQITDVRPGCSGS